MFLVSSSNCARHLLAALDSPKIPSRARNKSTHFWHWWHCTDPKNGDHKKKVPPKIAQLMVVGRVKVWCWWLQRVQQTVQNTCNGRTILLGTVVSLSARTAEIQFTRESVCLALLRTKCQHSMIKHTQASLSAFLKIKKLRFLKNIVKTHLGAPIWKENSWF